MERKRYKKMEERNMRLEIARLINEPLNPSLRSPIALSAIADVSTAKAGERLTYFATDDPTVSEIYQVNTSTGKIVTVKIDPLTDTQITFTGLNSRKMYVLLDSVLNSPDVNVLGSKKGLITDGMDKLEVKKILDAIIALSAVETITPGSGEDLYDVIERAIAGVEDYGNGYALLCGSQVKLAIDNYAKKYAKTYNYPVGLSARLKEQGVDIVKVFGKVTTGTASANEADTASPSVLLDTNKFVLVATNSNLQKGKPIKFIRRIIPPAIAKMMGATIDKTERGLFISNDTVNVAGADTLGYSLYGYESLALVISNTHAIKKSASLASIL